MRQLAVLVDDGTKPGSAQHIAIERVSVGSVTRSCVQLSGVTDMAICDSMLGSCDRGVMMVGVQGAAIARMNIGGAVTTGVTLAGGSAEIEVRQISIANVENESGSGSAAPRASAVPPTAHRPDRQHRGHGDRVARARGLLSFGVCARAPGRTGMPWLEALKFQVSKCFSRHFMFMIDPLFGEYPSSSSLLP